MHAIQTVFRVTGAGYLHNTKLSVLRALLCLSVKKNVPLKWTYRLDYMIVSSTRGNQL
jgi:hypothetical protein